MTGGEVALLAALCSVLSGGIGIAIGRNGHVKQDVCDMRHDSLVNRIDQGFESVHRELDKLNGKGGAV